MTAIPPYKPPVGSTLPVPTSPRSSAKKSHHPSIHPPPRTLLSCAPGCNNPLTQILSPSPTYAPLPLHTHLSRGKINPAREPNPTHVRITESPGEFPLPDFPRPSTVLRTVFRSERKLRLRMNGMDLTRFRGSAELPRPSSSPSPSPHLYCETHAPTKKN